MDLTGVRARMHDGPQEEDGDRGGISGGGGEVGERGKGRWGGHV